jgi:hypothetical protein
MSTTKQVGEYTIQSDVPIPLCRSKYPWAEMKVGDSVFIPKKLASVSNASTSWAVRNNAKFTHRTEGTGTRIWRIS